MTRFLVLVVVVALSVFAFGCETKKGTTENTTKTTVTETKDGKVTGKTETTTTDKTKTTQPDAKGNPGKTSETTTEKTTEMSK